MSEWQRIGSRGDLAEDQPLSGSLGGKEISVHESGGAIYAINDECPHNFAPLSSGYVEDGKITCMLHQAVFELATGKCVEGALGDDPDSLEGLACYEVKVEGDDVLVKI